MRSILKIIALNLPSSFRKHIVVIREFFWFLTMEAWERIAYPNLQSHTRETLIKGKKSRILIYHINGMGHGGTERNLQHIANSLVSDYEVFFMHGFENKKEDRQRVLDSRVFLIPFSYVKNETSVPHKLYGMDPHIKQVLNRYGINLIVTASPGYSHYPWNLIKDTPIILLNIFGAPTVQKNIVSVIYNSKTTLNHAEQWIGHDSRAHVRYAPLFKIPPSNARGSGTLLRKKFGISDTDFVFGRIGRDDDQIFDPIGIRAWQIIAQKHPNSHYLIMSPPPKLVKIVQEENIPRVHLLPPSSLEQDVWAFHGALDAFAHFRYDGETSGVAIAESLTLGNPIITHRSHIWNAHTEYLTHDCSRIANIDDYQEYALHMEEYIDIYKRNPQGWSNMKQSAMAVGEKHFSPEKYSTFIKDLTKKALEINP